MYYHALFILTTLLNIILTNAHASGTLASGTLPKPTGNCDATSTAYADILCSCDVINSPTSDPSVRWAEANCPNALNDFNQQWDNGLSTQRVPYVAALSNYWHGPPNLNCNVTHSSCTSGVEKCGDVSMDNKYIDNPAAYLIINSLSNFHNFYLNQYEALTTTEASMANTIGTFMETFSPAARAPPKTSGLTVLQIIAIVRLVFGFVGAFVLNGAIVQLEIVTETVWAKDVINDIVNGGLRLTGTFFQNPSNQAIATSLGQEIAIRDQLSSFISNFIGTIQGLISLYVENMFSGQGNSTNELTNLLSNGKWLDSGFSSPNLFDMTKILSRILYVQLLPRAWNWNPHIHPVIIMVDKDCNDPNLHNDPVFSYMSSQTASQTQVCYQGKTFFLCDVDDDTDPGLYGDPSAYAMNVQTIGLPKQVSLATTEYLTPLPGSETLDGNNWGNITKLDIVASVYQGYVLNNNKNGYQLTADELFNNGQDNILQDGIQTPGFFSGIPICSADLAFHNWFWRNYLNSVWEGYPCGCPTGGYQCSFADCMGRNTVDGKGGMCLGGQSEITGMYAGCPCQNVCGSNIDNCSKNGCAGISNPDSPSGKAVCTAGSYNGCPCFTECTGVERCDENYCAGTSLYFDNGEGMCTDGQFKYCRCFSTCVGKSGCKDNNCNGENNCGLGGCRCTDGAYRGCYCNP